jgi:hypothetical protein
MTRYLILVVVVPTFGACGGEPTPGATAHGWNPHTPKYDWQAKT